MPRTQDYHQVQGSEPWQEGLLGSPQGTQGVRKVLLTVTKGRAVALAVWL